MKQIVECVPNFSEGRDSAKIDAIAQTIEVVPGALLLDRSSDPDHNRSVFTMAGAPDAILDAAILAVDKAAELIDLREHAGEHPRIGATDVLPFVPVRGVSMQDCISIAHRAGRAIWERYRIPVYFYEAASTRPERKDLANVRRGRFEGLREAVLRDPQRAPDVGEPHLHPSAGAIAVGARKFLIAYNINLNTPDIEIARRVAKAIRYSSGGLPCVKAIGVDLQSRRLAQVSINLTDFEQTSLRTVFEAVKNEAARYICEIAGSEIIGLVPQRALDADAISYLRLENFSATQVFENRLHSAENRLTNGTVEDMGSARPELRPK